MSCNESLNWVNYNSMETISTCMTLSEGGNHTKICVPLMFVNRIDSGRFSQTTWRWQVRKWVSNHVLLFTESKTMNWSKQLTMGLSCMLKSIRHLSVKSLSETSCIVRLPTFDPDLYQTNLWDYLCLHCFRCFRDGDLNWLQFSGRFILQPAQGGVLHAGDAPSFWAARWVLHAGVVRGDTT